MAGDRVKDPQAGSLLRFGLTPSKTKEAQKVKRAAFERLLQLIERIMVRTHAQQ